MLHPPHRLDLRAADIAAAATACLTRTDAAAAQAALEDAWDGLAFLSVRSALCALLEAVDWAPGSEVLVSALTIGDIPRIIEAHGFVPVAVDVDARTLAPIEAELTRLVTPKTRAIVIAHLFGARVDLAPAAALARKHGLLLVEDCAQAFVGPGFRGDPRSDVAMFSFGTLKTHTALGGALVTVKDHTLRARMADVAARWPRQPRRAFAQKIAKACAFLVAQVPLVYTLLATAVSLSGRSLGAVLRHATRGFPADDAAQLLALLRQRPCAPLLVFLHHRLATFSPARLAARAAAGERVRTELGADVVVGAAARARTHWIFAVRSQDPARLRAALAAAGFDASGASNITAVGGDAARRLVDEIVFVPAYPELSPRALAALARTLAPARAPAAHEIATTAVAA